MPRYFLHTRNPGHVVEDQEGEELPDLSLAIEAAVDTARQLMIDRLKQREPADGRGSRMEVADDDGTLLAAVEFQDVLAGKY